MRRIVAIVLSSAVMLQVAPLMAASPMHAARAGQAPVATGAINGTAQSAGGQMLPNYTVQVRNLQNGELAGTTTSNAAGSFSFTGLTPGNYVIEVVNQAGTIVGSSSAVSVAAGATVGVAVSAATAAAAVGAAAGGISTALLVTTVAVAAGIAGVVVVARNNASPSR
jgi:carboxypeptidase family protein